MILPTVTVNDFGYVEQMNLQLVFRSQEDATSILKTPEETRRIKVRAAISKLDKAVSGGYAFHGHRYILEAAPMEIVPEPLERMSGTGVKIRFLVKRYVVNVEGEELLAVGGAAVCGGSKQADGEKLEDEDDG